MFYALITDSNGNGTGSHFYDVKPDTLPANEVACTADQASNPTAWTVSNGSLVAALSFAQAQQIASLTASYGVASTQSVSYTSKGGVTATFQADPDSQGILMKSLSAYTPFGSTPSGFYWVASDNTKVPFTLADLQGLADAMISQGWTAFQKLQDLKANVRAATTVANVQAVTW